MINAQYALTLSSSLVSHWQGRQLTLQDTDEHFNLLELKAHVRSGDYFSLLASRLDDISQTMSADHEAESIGLQHLVEELLYLQRRYQIIHKASEK